MGQDTTADRDTREMLKAVVKHLKYSFDQIAWKFEGLTAEEQKIFQTPGRFAATKDWVDSIEKGAI
jgi:hypothetical protein